MHDLALFSDSPKERQEGPEFCTLFLVTLGGAILCKECNN